MDSASANATAVDASTGSGRGLIAGGRARTIGVGACAGRSVFAESIARGSVSIPGIISLGAGCFRLVMMMTGHGILDFVNDVRHDGSTLRVR